MPQALSVRALIACLALAAASEAWAQQRFPYQAVVIADNLEVRSGPGEKFYVASLAAKNEPVTVRRHDHGGWYMIDPPRGSFSLIEASQVKRMDGNRGVVQPTRDPHATVTVRVGSNVSPEHSLFSRELALGDEVTILGEVTITSATGPVKMLKIAPPAQEFRWVRGELIAPTNSQVREQVARDPYQIPVAERETLAQAGLLPSQIQQPVEQTRVAAEKPVQVAAAGDVPIPLSPPASASPPIPVDELDAIDRRYRDMAARAPEEWSFDQIEADYRELRTRANAPVISLIDQRLESLGQRQRIARQYRSFIELTSATSRREAELVQRLGNYSIGAMLPAPLGSNSPVLPAQTPQVVAQPETPVTLPELSPRSPEENPVSPPVDAGPAKMSGAGIVSEVSGSPGMPPFALISPDGKFLAFLQPAGAQTQLKNWIGREAGMIGPRQHQASLGADIIQVQRVVPVNLSKPASPAP